MSFTLSPTCKALDTNMGERKRGESHDLHRQVRMGYGGGGHASELDPCRSTIAKNAIDDRKAWRREHELKWLRAATLIDPLGERATARRISTPVNLVRCEVHFG